MKKKDNKEAVEKAGESAYRAHLLSEAFRDLFIALCTGSREEASNIAGDLQEVCDSYRGIRALKLHREFVEDEAIKQAHAAVLAMLTDDERKYPLSVDAKFEPSSALHAALSLRIKREVSRANQAKPENKLQQEFEATFSERSPGAVGEGTWSVFAEKMLNERDEAREKVSILRGTLYDLVRVVNKLLDTPSNGVGATSVAQQMRNARLDLRDEVHRAEKVLKAWFKEEKHGHG